MDIEATRTVLVVEDDLSIQEAIRDLLEVEGFSVVGAANGQIAIDFLHSTDHLPNLILLDLMMPVMNGFEFREEQMQESRLAYIPVVIMSADGRVWPEGSQITDLRYIKKPFAIDLMIAAVKECSA